MTTWTTESKFEPEFDGIVYLTGATNDGTIQVARERPMQLGLLATPASGVHRQRDEYTAWAADNGCFKERHPIDGKPFDPDVWLAWLHECGIDKCLFVNLPDVVNWFYDPDHPAADKTGHYPVGDAVGTWARSEPWIDVIHALDFPIAITLQDGVEQMTDVWAEILERVDAVFIGGSDAFKLGPAVPPLIAEAGSRGLWTHAGRVNSYKRLSYFNSIGCDSADGTFVRFHRDNWMRMAEWFEKLDQEKAA